MDGGSLTAAVGPLFYVTNAQAVIELTGAELHGTSGTFLAAGANSWGTTGANGGHVSLTASEETINGDVTCDNISTVALTLKDHTTLTGAIDTDHAAQSTALTLDATSRWNVTGTSYLTELTDADASLANIQDNGHTIYYDANTGANGWLNGQTLPLSGGGQLTPG